LKGDHCNHKTMPIESILSRESNRGYS